MGRCSFGTTLVPVETLVVLVAEVAMKELPAFEDDADDSLLLMVAPAGVDFVLELLARSVVGAMPLCDVCDEDNGRRFATPHFGVATFPYAAHTSATTVLISPEI